MECNSCHNGITNDDYCICTKCRQTVCPSCADKSAFVCESCGGDIAYLS
ncbi:MAG: hypothetical protein NC350_01100 [Corallococcus sp.]|nr:hypothetical protein [Corallococcus sp.]